MRLIRISPRCTCLHNEMPPIAKERNNLVTNIVVQGLFSFRVNVLIKNIYFVVVNINCFVIINKFYILISVSLFLFSCALYRYFSLFIFYAFCCLTISTETKVSYTRAFSRKCVWSLRINVVCK